MTTWIITTTGKISNLLDASRELSGETRAVVVGDANVGGVDSAVRIPLAEGQPAEALAPAVAQYVTAEAGDVVLVADTAEERVLGASVAAHLNAPILMGVKKLSDGEAVLSRFGGLTDETVKVIGVGVAVLDGGESVEGDVIADVVDIQGAHDAIVISTDATESETVNLSVAERVVGAGRGFREEGDLQIARDFAEALGAELGVTRPLAEGYDWMPRESYIGVSGQVIAPKLYVAAGVSGQIHHTAGITDSDVIVAINDDELATIFEFADYGIVGDLYEVLPKLTAALKG